MDRTEFETYIREAYDTEPDYPWEKQSSYAVYRHRGNRKWFAVVLDIPGVKLELQSREQISIVNLKCEERLMGSFLGRPGIYPAYHMNKANWLSLALDGSADNDDIKLLLSLSHSLTAPSPRTKRKTKAPRADTAAT